MAWNIPKAEGYVRVWTTITTWSEPHDAGLYQEDGQGSDQDV